MRTSPIPKIPSKVLWVIKTFSLLASARTQENKHVRFQDFQNLNEITNSLLAINFLTTMSIPQIIDSCCAIGRAQEIIEERHLMPTIAITRQYQIQATINFFPETPTFALADL